jgi:hypothetical protein
VLCQGKAVARRPSSQALKIAAVAALMFGGWAAFANREYDVIPMARAGLVQAAFSLCSTFCLTSLLESFLHSSRSRVTRWLLGMLLAPLIMLGGLALAHAWVHTPNILKAIIPSMTSCVVFCVTYTLLRERRKSPPA